MMQMPESVHLWAAFTVGHGLHLMKRAGLSKSSALSGTSTRLGWFKDNLTNVLTRFALNCIAFSYWMHNPDVATQALGLLHVPINLSLAPSHATAGLFGLSGDNLLDWAAAKVPFLQKEIPPPPNGKQG